MRYIDADALVKRLKHSPLFLGTHMQFKDGVINLVERQPTADVAEVVRCKDCKHLLLLDDGSRECTRIYMGTVHNNDYCCHGERREENEG